MQTMFVAVSFLCVQSVAGSMCFSNVQQVWFSSLESCAQALALEKEYQHGLAEKAGEVIYDEARHCLPADMREPLKPFD